MSQLPEPTASPGPEALPKQDALPAPGGVAAPAAPVSRRRSAARWGIAGVAALVVAGVTVGAVRVGGAVSGPEAALPGAAAAAQPGGDLAAADAPVAPIAFTATPPAQAPDSFDPLVRFARFGRLPAGMVPRTTVVQAGDQGGYTIEAGLPERSIGAQVAVTFFPRGVTPHRECLATANLVRPMRGMASTPTAAAAPAVPAVHGKPVKAVDGRMRWEYAPGAWAEAVGKDLVDREGEDPAANLRALADIAADLRYGVEALRFPLVVGGVPRSLRLAVASVTERSKTGWSSGLVFTAGPYCGGENVAPKDALAVRVDAIIPGYGWTGDHSNATVDGRHAVKQEFPTGATGLAVYDNPGPHVAVTTSDAATTQLVGGDGLVGLYRRIQVLGATDLSTIAQPADQGGWTTDPVR
ncbi:hypothetical protein [Catellatospora sichuanensis]|uniref:hypothetical protein n=1 Tax=Catellatospora sichuanensis TaxID=1969805 RepID=UPI001182E90B|nr:hypothetical protein [Catellatospora sichuanensis]